MPSSLVFDSSVSSVIVPATPLVVADLPSTTYVIEKVAGFACCAPWLVAFAEPLLVGLFCALLAAAPFAAPDAALSEFFEVEVEFCKSAAFPFPAAFSAFAVAFASL